MPKIIDFSTVKISCASCNLYELCLPRGLEKTDLDRLEKMVERIHPMRAGEFVFRSGDRFQYLYAVRTGVIKLYTTTRDGEEQIIGFYYPGEILGLDAIENQVHSCTAVALETSSCCAFPFARLNDLCQSVSGLNTQMLRLMSRELSRDNELLLTLSKKKADEKLATFLVTLSNRFKRLGYSPYEFRLTMSRQEIGNYLGLTLETVSRVLNKFRREELINIDHKMITIKEPDNLMSIAACTQGSDHCKTAS